MNLVLDETKTRARMENVYKTYSNAGLVRQLALWINLKREMELRIEILQGMINIKSYKDNQFKDN